MARFREWLPAYSGHRLYGAVAYLEADESVVLHAERRGLFVIRATGSSASIVNDPASNPDSSGGQPLPDAERRYAEYSAA